MSRTRERVTDAFDALEKDEKLVEEVLAMSPEALAADLGPARVAKAHAEADAMQKRFLALAAALPEDLPAEGESAAARTSIAGAPPDAAPHVATATSPEPEPAEGHGRVVRLRRMAPLWLLAAAFAALAVGAGAALGLFDRRGPAPSPRNETPDQPYTAPTAPEPVPDNRAATSVDAGRADPAPSPPDAAKAPDRTRPRPAPAPVDHAPPNDKAP
jgi:hypothetical protein